jgi:hypothetical protein
MDKRYNEEKYDVTLLVRRFDAGGTEQQQYLFNNNHLQSVRFISDLEYSFPVVEIGMFDFADLIQTTFLADGFSTVEIKMIPDELFEDATIELTFIVDMVKIIDKVNNGSVIQITGVGEDRFILNSKLEYSTGADQLGRPVLKPTTEIIDDILGSINFPYSKSKFFRTCQNEIHYITPVNASVKSVIDDLLRQTISTESGIYALYYSLLDKEAKFLSLKTQLADFDTNLDVKNYNIFQIFDDDNETIAPMVINDIQHLTGMPASHHSSMSGESIMNVFDYEKRIWKSETYDNSDYNDITGFVNSPVQSQNKNSALIKTVPLHLNAPELKYKSEHVNHYDHSTYKKLSNVDIDTDAVYENFMNMESIQFNIKGVIHREVGHMIKISQSTNSSKPRYEGYWFIKRVICDFRNGTFVNNIIASRPNIKETK